MKLDAELTAARDAAAIAAKVILGHSERLTAVASAPVDVTTQADRDSQEAILNRLAAEFSGDAFLGEESTATLAKLPHAGPRLWIIDPIDGTRGFVTKNGEYSVMIALAIDGEVVLGVVAEPAFNRQVYAVVGQGCWLQEGNIEPRAVRVTSTSTLAEATLIQSHIKPGQGTKEVAALRPKKIVETYSAGVKLARVADGTVDLYVCDYSALNSWDVAAGHALVVAAGGQVSSFNGTTLRYGGSSPLHRGGLLATNGALHAVTVSELATPV